MTCTLVAKLTPDIKKISPTKQGLLISLSCLYICWIYANLAANGLFALNNAHGGGFRLIGEIVYYAGITLSGIIFPLYLTRRYNFKIRLVPETLNHNVLLTLSGLVIFAVVIGSAAMGDQGMTLGDLYGKSLIYLISPIPIFLPTMVAYSMLWHVVFFQGFRKIYGKRRHHTVLAVLTTAAIYALYHITCIDELTTIDAMLSEIAITFAIRVVMLSVLAMTTNLLPVFICDWVMNYFVFTPMVHFHTAPWKWPIGLMIVFILWWIFRYKYKEGCDL